MRLPLVQALLAGVIMVGRSPSSAIAIVSELKAEGPFTLTVLSVTMVTDVIVIVLFTAACEFAHVLFSSEVVHGPRSVLASFASTLAMQLGLSIAHGVMLSFFVLPILHLDSHQEGDHAAVAPSLGGRVDEAAHPSLSPGSMSEAVAVSSRAAMDEGSDTAESSVDPVRHGRQLAGPRPTAAMALQPAMLLVLGGYAFAAEGLLRRLMVVASARVEAAAWLRDYVECIRIEPMLACMVAGFLVCNTLGRRAQLNGLLDSCLPPLLAFFFFSTGTEMRVHALRRTWPTAITLFFSRLVAIWIGNYAGTLASASCSSKGGRRRSGEPPAHSGLSESACDIARGAGASRWFGWGAYVTQAGVTLGLSDEVATNFPTWGPALQAPLISAVVLSQIVGPPLLKYALTAAGEAGIGESAHDDRAAILAGKPNLSCSVDTDTEQAPLPADERSPLTSTDTREMCASFDLRSSRVY